MVPSALMMEFDMLLRLKPAGGQAEHCSVPHLSVASSSGVTNSSLMLGGVCWSCTSVPCRSASLLVEERYSAATPLLCRLSTWFCINAAANNIFCVRHQREHKCHSTPMTLSAKHEAQMAELEQPDSLPHA